MITSSTKTKDLSQSQLIPYAIEMRDAIDAALYRFEQIEKLAVEWMQVYGSTPRSLPQIQSHLFDEIEAFLAAFTRISYLIFPASNESFAQNRGKSIRRALGISETFLENERCSRDNWVHHDERIDQGVSEGKVRSNQLFKYSTEITDEILNGSLRVLEVDTLRFHSQTRYGGRYASDLKELKSLLLQIDYRKLVTNLDIPK
jgi:hypothetical protein